MGIGTILGGAEEQEAILPGEPLAHLDTGYQMSFRARWVERRWGSPPTCRLGMASSWWESDGVRLDPGSSGLYREVSDLKIEVRWRQ